MNNFVRFPELRATSPNTGPTSAMTKPSFLADRVSTKEFAHLQAGVPLKPSATVEQIMSRTARQSTGGIKVAVGITSKINASEQQQKDPVEDRRMSE